MNTETKGNITSNVVAGIITAIIITAGAALWNWSSNGDLVRALGGITKKEHNELVANLEIHAKQAVASEINSKIEERIAKMVSGTEVPSTGGNNKTATCASGTYMIGNRFQIDRGGPHGIISNIIPVCKKFE